MGNKPESPLITLETVAMTDEQKREMQYRQAVREVKIASARCHVIKSEVVSAYQILERIRFDYLGDTAFRDKITKAKSSLEDALQDFLLDDSYWKKKAEEMRKHIPESYDQLLNSELSGDQSEWSK